MTQPTQVVFAIASASSEALSKSVDVEVSVDVDVVAVDVAVEVKVEVEVTYKTGWLVVELTPLKNMSQIGLFQPSFGMKIKTYLKPPSRKRFDSFLRLAHLGKRKIIDSKVVPFWWDMLVALWNGLNFSGGFDLEKGIPFLPWSWFSEKWVYRSWNFCGLHSLKLPIHPWKMDDDDCAMYFWNLWSVLASSKAITCTAPLRVFVKPTFGDVDVVFFLVHPLQKCWFKLRYQFNKRVFTHSLMCKNIINYNWPSCSLKKCNSKRKWCTNTHFWPFCFGDRCNHGLFTRIARVRRGGGRCHNLDNFFHPTKVDSIVPEIMFYSVSLKKAL